ncbi:MAG TPA: SpoIID/LytB domain-containing protein [Myxococcota bacterium]|nr:SpoIID/LytB domain-containing protein [Myxococcota bacterium]
MRAPLVALGILLALASRPAAADDALRVRVAAGVQAVSISGRSLRIDGRSWRSESLRISAAGGRLRIDGKPADRTLVVDARGPVVLDGRELPGALRLSAQGERSLDAVSLVPLEPYVASAVASETPPGWPAEALKAQAVVARSYALHERTRHAEEAFDLESSVISQRFGAEPVPAAALAAARATEGQYLAFSGAPILAAFHSSSGGSTASAAEVWGESIPYLRSVSSPDDAAPDYFWSYDIALSDLAAALREAGYAPSSLDAVRVTERSESGRVERIQLGSVLLSGRDLREVLGGRALRSAMFEVRVEDGQARFLGSGSGHGVGLCQWGASELARRGASYRAILAHYYPGTDLRRLRASDGRNDWSARR